MAQGDAVAAISNIGAGAVWTVQPSAGEEWIIKRIFNQVEVGIAPNKVADTGFIWYDGTNSSQFGDSYNPENSITQYEKPLQLHVNNTIYFRLVNNRTAPANIGYCGIQTK